MDAVADATTWRFDDFLVDMRALALFRLKEGRVQTPVQLGSRAFGILCVLIKRRGEFVTKQEILDTVWPDSVVEESNLTVQMSALRRVLDESRSDGSCIQTVPGRGYRFLPLVTELRDATVSDADQILSSDQHSQPNSAIVAPGIGELRREMKVPPWRRSSFIGWAAGLGFLFAVVIGLSVYRPGMRTERPRLSIVVLPFENLSGDKAEDYLADAVTDDLTSDLSQRLSAGIVISRESAYTYKGKTMDARTIGEQLGVRYLIDGSVRRQDGVLRVNAQLISTESRAQLWADRFDEPIKDLGSGQEQIVQRLGGAFGWEMTQVEAARSVRERPNNPDVFDLVLRARSLYRQPYSLKRNAEAIALDTQALKLDPGSVPAKLGLAAALLDSPDYQEDLGRVAAMISEAANAAPGSYEVLALRAELLRAEERWPEAMAASEQLIELYPNSAYGFNGLANEKLAAGAADEAIPLFEKAIRLDPRSGYLFNRLRRIGYLHLVLGHEQEAVAWLQRALAANPDAPDWLLARNFRELAAAYALMGRVDDAHTSLARATQLSRFATVRGEVLQDPAYSEAAATQVKRYQEGIRLAGLRDHADEDADFGVAPDGNLHRGTGGFDHMAGLSPTTAPGVTTIRTADLVAFLAKVRPIIVDTVLNSWGRSIPGAVGLKLSGLGGGFHDAIQDRLSRKMQALSMGDMSSPIVAVGWNSETFDGRNLALRLAAIGYTQVYWYRGGREAWEMNGLPENEMTLSDW